MKRRRAEERNPRNARWALLLKAAALALLAAALVVDPALAQGSPGPEDDVEDQPVRPDDDISEAEDDSEEDDTRSASNTVNGVRLPPQTTSDCSGQSAIVAASDEAGLSDLYSAMTLAGVLDTECIVLAGPRDAGMPAGQQTRLDQALSGGWIVGGIAAVPPLKTAGRTMKRITGVDRWHTARLVGAVAADPSADIAPLHATIDAWNPVTDEADCSGKVPIVVASDAAALSDLYSAVTLAGVLDTDCIVFAGPRGSPMPPDQRARLGESRPGGWIVGGTAAVPPLKTAGREMKRIAGADRWRTALFVGIVASDPDVDVDALAVRYPS